MKKISILFVSAILAISCSTQETCKSTCDSTNCDSTNCDTNTCVTVQDSVGQTFPLDSCDYENSDSTSN